MALRLHFADILDFDVKGLLYVDDYMPLTPGAPVVRSHARGGEISMHGLALPGLAVAGMTWNLAEDVEIEDTTNSADINIVFQVGGHMQTRFRGLGHELDMQAGRHNLVHTPEVGEHHRMAASEPLDLLHLSLERSYFQGLIGTESAWAERALRALDDGRPFSGIPGTSAITPAMRALIAGIRHPPAGPMQHLLLQARITELLALQFEQFIAADGSQLPPDGMSPDEAVRLHALKDYLDGHFLESHSLATLARRALLNDFKLKRGFRQLFGTTVFGYLKARRMAHAERLLRDHALLVEEVADLLGYEHAHHFSAAYKKHFGRRPSERA